jgi:tetratricopeptide (TPR) repeat protein
MEIKREPLTYYNVGLVLIDLNRFDEAKDAFEETIEFDKDYDKGYYGIGLASYYKSDFGEAFKFLKRHVDMAGDKSEEPAYKLLGLAAFNTKKYGEAAIYLKRAAFLNDEPKELGNIYYFLANSYLEEGKLAKSSSYYQKAIALEPNYKDVINALAGDFKAQGRAEASAHLLRQLDDKN